MKKPTPPPSREVKDGGLLSSLAMVVAFALLVLSMLALAIQKLL